MHSKLSKLNDNIICQLSHWKNRKEFSRLRTQTGDYSLEGFDRLRCIYIHIPKAAGVSINKALFGNYGGGHQSVQAYKRIFGPAVYRKYFTFTFVRNPYSRLLSAYRFLKSGGFDERDRSWAARNLTDFDNFSEFVMEWIDETSIWSKYHFRPQYSFVCDIDDDPEVDFIGKVESIREDFDKVCSVLNIPNTLSIQNKGSRDNSAWQQGYTDEALEKVANIYRRDFETFAYEVSLPTI